MQSLLLQTSDILWGHPWRLVTSLRLVTQTLTIAYRDVLYNQSIWNTWQFSIFIFPTARIRVCKLWFVSTDVICGNPYPVHKKSGYTVRYSEFLYSSSKYSSLSAYTQTRLIKCKQLMMLLRILLNLHPEDANSFQDSKFVLFMMHPISYRRQNVLDRIASPDRVSIPWMSVPIWTLVIDAT